jgi:hypothetical protein
MKVSAGYLATSKAADAPASSNVAAPIQVSSQPSGKRGLIPRRKVTVFDKEDEKAAATLLKDF